MQIEESHAKFQSLIRISQGFLDSGRHAHALAAAQMAGLFAAYNHPGQFASSELEQILTSIGTQKVRPPEGSAAPPNRAAAIRNVLHVLTAAKDVDGHSRFVWRWIGRDPGRRHSVALTEQLYFEVPGPIRETVEGRRGEVHVLDRGGADIVGRARALRALAGEADVVFLHGYPEDVVPVLAFADKRGLPPIVFVVHDDHQFWTGVNLCDAFVHLRESGIALSQERRGIPRDRTALLPIPLEPVGRSIAKDEARKQLGLPRDTVILLSIARAVKYTPTDRQSFPAVMKRVLDRHPNVVVLVLGPEDTGPWREAGEETRGRLRALGQRSDTALFYQAADIYLDSFPLSTNTSLLEAGGFGLPLVSYFPYAAEADVLGPGSPGLDGTLLRLATLDDYLMAIATLVEDQSARLRLGEEARQQIRRLHSGDVWNGQLETVYRAIAQMPANTSIATAAVRGTGEADVFLAEAYKGHKPFGWVVGWYARHLPYLIRLQLLFRIQRVDPSFSFSLFLPSWVKDRVASRMKGWRQWRGLSRLLPAKS